MFVFYLTLMEDDAERALFVTFYKRCFPRLYHTALSILRTHEGAEDAVQAAIFKILSRHPEKFFEKMRRSWDETECWAVLVVEHIAIDMQRKDAWTVPMDETWDAPAPSDTEGDAAYDRLRALITALPEIYRVVLERKFLLEWRDTEIARELGLSVSTVASRVARGRKLLQKMLEEEGYACDGERV